MAQREHRRRETWSARAADASSATSGAMGDPVGEHRSRAGRAAERPPSAAEVRGVTRRFVTGADLVVALDDVHLAVPAGQLTVVAGPSGSGKSTLLAILACLQRPDAGTVTIGPTDVLALGRRARRRVRRDRLGIVLPQPSENLLDHLDALGNLRWAGERRAHPAHDGSGPAGLDAPRLLDVVGLAAAGHRRVRELSGGEQQRLAVAVALAGGPDLVVLDEPTSALDRSGAAALVEVLGRLAALGATMVIATHDPIVIGAADTVAELDHGGRTR